MTIAVVPVKDLERAKERLAGRLTQLERRRLVVAMLEDVLSALSGVKELSGIIVVTHEEEIAAIAARFGAEALTELQNQGYSEAVQRATRELEHRQEPAMLVIPADVPALAASEVSAMLQALRPGPSIVLVPSRDERGTNAALVSPPGAFSFRFGEPSFLPHVQRARELGLHVDILHLPGLALDLDTPADIEFFLQTPTKTRAYRLLCAAGGS